MLRLSRTIDSNPDGWGLIREIKPIVRADLRSPNSIRKQMAFDLRGAVVASGGVGEDELLVIGWTREQIRTHARDAITLARRQAGIDGAER